VGVSSGGRACLGAREFLFKGGAAILATNSQNGDIITLSFYHCIFNNDEGRGLRIGNWGKASAS
jgi:hypothetical protein